MHRNPETDTYADERASAMAVADALEPEDLLPELCPRGIRWSGGRGRRPLVFALAFTSPAPATSPPAVARIEASDLGAFRPWRPLADIDIPALRPGEIEIVTGLAASGSLPPAPPFVDPGGRLLDVHWAGGLRVSVGGGTDVRRQVRRSIGLRAGRPNVVRFQVGDGVADAYVFSLHRVEPGWIVSLHRGEAPGAPKLRGAKLEPGAPVELVSDLVAAVIRPPERADTGTLAIGVVRTSSGEREVVELELETSRLGSRCHYL